MDFWLYCSAKRGEKQCALTALLFAPEFVYNAPCDKNRDEEGNMAYQALYRRFRPTRFEEFVGQEAIVKTLRGQVMNGRIAHAYLFCGTRGTGKTSAAKIFARAINCEAPEAGDPCGKCPTCLALQDATNMDILEIDAASNNSVDEIRDLRDKVKYPPSVGRYKVYIIDEVHMLSSGAFNALLKTLEEPPEHAKFILATTEPQKLLATILSRCQRFNFGRIPAALIEQRLEKAFREDGIRYENEAVARIARAAEGGMRDAWSIADMCLGYAMGADQGLTDALVREVLGSADRDTLFRLTQAMISADAPSCIRQIDEAMQNGQEVSVFLRDISTHLRSVLMASVCGAEQAAQVLGVTQEDARQYVEQASSTSRDRLMAMLRRFLEAETEAKGYSQPRYALEAAALRCCQPPEKPDLGSLMERVARLEERKTGAAVPEGLEERLRRLEAGAQNAPSGEPAPKEAPKEIKASPDKPEKPREKPVAAEAREIWKRTLEKYREMDISIFGLLRKGRLLSADDSHYVVVFDKEQGAITVKMFIDPEMRKKVEAVLTEIAGVPSTFQAAVEGSFAERDENILRRQEREKKADEERMDQVMQAFGRENVIVVP